MHHPQRRDDVGDLRHGQQAAEADYLDRNPALLQGRPQRGELAPLAAQNGDVARTQRIGPALRPPAAVRRDTRRQAQQHGDLARRPVRLVGCGLQQGADHLTAAGPVRRRDQPRHLGRQRAQILLNCGCRIQDPAGVAEAGGQQPHRRRRGVGCGEIDGEAAQVPGARAAPAVDGLARITDRGDRMTAAEQRCQQHQLRLGGVLVLVEQHHLVAGPLGGPHFPVPGGDPRSERHLVAIVDDLPGSLGRRVGGGQRQ